MSPGIDAPGPTAPSRRRRGWLVVAIAVVLVAAGGFIAWRLTAGPPTVADLQRRAGCTDAEALESDDPGTTLGSCVVNGSPVLFGTFANNDDRDYWVNALGAMATAKGGSWCVAQGNRWAAAPIRTDLCADLARRLGVEPTTLVPHFPG